MTSQTDRNRPNGFIDFHDLQAEVEASYTPDQQAEYDQAEADAETQIELAELVYQMRTQAGISQTELARRMGSRQPFISDLEHGGRTPTVATLNRIARATGNRLRLTVRPETSAEAPTHSDNHAASL